MATLLVCRARERNVFTQINVDQALTDSAMTKRI